MHKDIYELFQHNFYRKFGNPKEIDNRFFVSKEQAFIYCEIPKVAISTIKKTLAQQIEGKDIDYNVHNRERFVLKSPSFYDLKKDQFDSFFKFIFVRNPYTRILSAYLDKIEKNDSIEKKQLYQFANIPQDKDVSFLEFLQILEKMVPVNMNPHFRPQYLNACYPLIEYDFIGKFETFQYDFERVLQKIFKDKTKSIITVNHHKTDAEKKLMQYYTIKTMNLVQSIYAQDFLYYNYSFHMQKASY